MRTIDWIDNDKKDVKWIVDMLKNELLFVDNSFQRRYVWVDKHQTKLIETILLGYSIPEIYLWVTETDATTGDTKYSIVDGQQRLGAIFDYINDKFKLKPTYLEHKEANYANKLFSQLDDEQKKLIWRYPFSMRVVKQEVSRNDIVNMFLRLNSTDKSLNPQELRNAEFDGAFLKLANELADLKFWEIYKIFSNNDLRRMQDIQFISSILIFLRLGIEAETTQASVNKVYDLFNKEYEEYEQDKQIVEKMIEEVTRLIKHSADNLKLLSKTTHLYTALVVAYNLIVQGQEFSMEHINKFTEFALQYQKAEDVSPEEVELLQEYKALTGEGTQRKQNRMRRVEIMKAILGIE